MTSVSPTIIFETDDLVVIDKPAGLLVHADGTATEDTVVTWFLSQYPSATGVGEQTLSPKGIPLERSGVVHRLDRETSGVMVLAKTASGHTHLKQQFHDRLAKKEYRAFVYGKMNERYGTINRRIGRSATDFRLRSAQRGARGLLRPAETDWERLVAGVVENEPFSYLKLVPKTGRTHQLRVHLKAIDRPIVADPLYAKHKVDAPSQLGFTRLALHAHMLTLIIPDGSTHTFTAPLPASFVAAEAQLVAADAAI